MIRKAEHSRSRRTWIQAPNCGKTFARLPHNPQKFSNNFNPTAPDFSG
jgi:hypothetical protein